MNLKFCTLLIAICSIGFQSVFSQLPLRKKKLKVFIPTELYVLPNNYKGAEYYNKNLLRNIDTPIVMFTLKERDTIFFSLGNLVFAKYNKPIKCREFENLLGVKFDNLALKKRCYFGTAISAYFPDEMAYIMYEQLKRVPQNKDKRFYSFTFYYVLDEKLRLYRMIQVYGYKVKPKRPKEKTKNSTI
ncbi:MAG: hypothetical protein WBJ36_07580 [Tenuifilum sp.]|uniref:hypothetical protein n=1 Tax=Tenuifilum sp. TaxID=2760880 RepID=UPI001B6CFD53|nr:hypothetical protein [Bacteroidales bacterium]HPP89752.1 hypothetical protein [Tenuifilum sp.]HQE55482.1 hypothetical protein [Tenuifilum sp.]HQG73449.1 hypothetical protein [Tenuifilum sp.]HQI89685.1 hypothetical protein [Tenuifilum sp.]